MVQKVGEAGDVLLDSLYHIIDIPTVPVSRFDVSGSHVQGIHLKLLHVQVAGSWADVASHRKTCGLFVQCTMKGEDGGIGDREGSPTNQGHLAATTSSW